MHVIDQVKPSPSQQRTPAIGPPPSPRAPGTIDGFKPKPQKKQPQSTAAPVHQPVTTGKRFTRLQSNTPRRTRPWQLIIAAATSPLVILLAFAGSIGEAVVVAAGVIALIARVRSAVPFVWALMALLGIAGLQALNAREVAQNLAVEAYSLLAVGVIALAMEVRRHDRRWFSKRRRV